MTISSFNSLSLEPPLVLFSIDRRSASLPLWWEARAFAINVLSENQKDISNRFARPRTNKWENTRVAKDTVEALVLLGVAAAFECAPWSRYDGGDHVLFIALVKQFRTFPERAPLVFVNGR
jgi:flavin reductase (DIM6/NTAB) family NADH-FMN oxidoreductase RutF